MFFKPKVRVFSPSRSIQSPCMPRQQRKRDRFVKEYGQVLERSMLGVRKRLLLRRSELIAIIFSMILLFITLMMGIIPALGLIYQSRHKPYNTDPAACCGLGPRIEVNLLSPREPGETPSVPLYGWFFESPFVELNPEDSVPKRPCVLVVHGHGMNQARMSSDGTGSIWTKGGSLIFHAGFHVMTLDLRNHGKSGDTDFVALGVKEWLDVVTGVRYLRHEQKCDSVGIWAESMGAVSTIIAGAKDFDGEKVDAIVLEAPFSRAMWTFERFLRLEFGEWVPDTFIEYVWSWMRVVAPFDVESLQIYRFLPSVKTAILHMHGQQDDLALFKNGLELYDHVAMNRTLARKRGEDLQEYLPVWYPDGHVHGYLQLDKYPAQLIGFLYRNLLKTKIDITSSLVKSFETQRIGYKHLNVPGALSEDIKARLAVQLATRAVRDFDVQWDHFRHYGVDNTPQHVTEEQIQMMKSHDCKDRNGAGAGGLLCFEDYGKGDVLKASNVRRGNHAHEEVGAGEGRLEVGGKTSLSKQEPMKIEDMV